MKYLFLFAFLLITSPVYALSLQWQPVTTDIDGQPLSPGNEVTAYKVYRCQSNTCSLANGALIATVPAPGVTFNIDAQPRPSTYFVTASNLSQANSAESNTVRVTPANKTVLHVEAN